MLLDAESVRAIPCPCVNTKRYGSMEVDTCERIAILLSEKFWGCETYPEAVEFFQARMNAQHLAMKLNHGNHGQPL